MGVLTYSGTPLIWPPTGHGNLAILTGWPYKRGRVKFHDWSTSSEVLTDTYHNNNYCTSKQSHIKMLTNLLDLDNNLSVRDVHKEEKSSKRSTGVLNKIISFNVVSQVLYLFRWVNY